MEYRAYASTINDSTGEEAERSHPDMNSRHSKETGLVIYLAFFVKGANNHYIVLTVSFKKWPETVARFISGTQEPFNKIERQK